MDLIEVSTGLKKSQDKRMVASKEKCGKKHQDTSEIGETIAKRASVFNSIRMVINMKVCGLWTKNMGKVPTGETNQVNLEENILVIGSKTKSMVEEHSSLKTATDMMVIGSMVCHKVRVE